MISDDTSTLFDPAAPAVRFRQGELIAWDPDTGTNSVLVGGGILENVPVLNTGEAIALRAGHVVGLLGQGMAWFIVGRITPANDGSFAGASLAFATDTVQATNFTVPTVLSSRASLTLPVPAWADEAAVMVIGVLSVQNTTVSAQSVYGQVFIAGTGGPANVVTATANPAVCSTTAAASRTVTEPGSSIVCDLRLRHGNNPVTGGWAAMAANIASVTATAIFRSTT